MTTGEIANGRSMIALISALPANSVRTRSSAQPTRRSCSRDRDSGRQDRQSRRRADASGVVIESNAAGPMLERAVEDHPERDHTAREVDQRERPEPPHAER
jgi:hypothetical protein